MQTLLFLFLLFFLPIAHGAVEVWSVTVMHIVSIVIVALWILSQIKDGQIKFHRTPLDLALFAFLLLAFLSLSYSVYPYSSRIQLYKIFNYIAIFYLLINTIKDNKKLLVLVWIVAIFGAAYAIFGLILVEGNLLGFNIFSSRRNWISLTYVNHNHFAGYLLMIIWLCLGLALSYRGAKRALLICLGISIAVAILFSLSRGGAIGLLGGMFFFFTIIAFCRGRQRFLWLLPVFFASVLLATTLLGGFDPVFEKINTLKVPTISGRGRFEIWDNTLILIKDNLWFGTGIGTFQYSYPRYQTGSINSFYSHAHNNYLELAAEMGVAGTMSVIICLITLFSQAIKKLIRQSDRQLQAIGTGALAGCFSLLIHEITDFNLHIPSNAFIFAVCAAIAFISAYADSKTPLALINIKLSSKRKVIFCFIFFLLFSLSLSAAISPFLGNIYHKEAKELQKTGNYDLAADTLEKAAFVDPGNADHFAAMGDLMVARAGVTGTSTEKRSFYLKSLNYYESAINSCQVRGYYYTKKAFILQLLGRLKEAEKAFQNALYLSPMNTFTHYNLGTFYLEQGELSNAYKNYREFLLLEQNDITAVLDEIWGVSPDYNSLKQAVPDIAFLRKELADFLYNKGEDQAAATELAYASLLEPTAEELAYAFSEDPDIINAMVHLKRIYNDKKYHEALTVVKKYLKQFGNNIYLQDQMALIYGELGMFDESISIYNQLITKYQHNYTPYNIFNRLYNDDSSPAWLYIRLAGIYSKAKLYQKAIETLQKGIKQWPDNSTLHHQLGYVYIKISQRQDAIDQWQKCLEVDPVFIPCKNALNNILKEPG